MVDPPNSVLTNIWSKGSTAKPPRTPALSFSVKITTIKKFRNMHMCKISPKVRKSQYYPSWILNAATASYQYTALSTCFHSLKRVPPRAKKAPNKVVLQSEINVRIQKMQKRKIKIKIHGKIRTLGYLSTGISTLIVLLTIRPEELPCELSQFCADEGCNKPDICTT